MTGYKQGHRNPGKRESRPRQKGRSTPAKGKERQDISTRNQFKILGQTASSQTRYQFSDLRKSRSTQKQRTLLRDLWIHIANEIPSQRVETAWANLTLKDAQELIADYYTKLSHFDAYQGPEPGEPAYDALSEKGKAFVDEGADPYFDVGSWIQGTY